MTEQPAVFPREMSLVELVRVLDQAGIETDVYPPGSTKGVVFTGIAYDSRDVRPGDVFFALAGAETDGHLYVAEAAASGAVAAVVEKGRFQAGGRGGLPEVPILEVPESRAAMGYAASRFFGDPSRDELRLAGVTGTNGKTTTTYLLASIFEAAGMRPGVIGTVEVRIGDRRVPAGRTTPEAPDLQRLLSTMVESGVKACALEVSSHALALGRVVGCRFETAVFTNLTRDHLDFHPSMDDYFEAKALLFDPAYTESAAVNVSDRWGRKLAARLRVPCVTYGREEDGAGFFAGDVRLGPESTSFVLTAAEGRKAHRVRVEVPLAGTFAVWNALAAAAGAGAMGIGLDETIAGLESAPTVPGRFERVSAGQDFLAVVDYAHTPDSVRSVLASARALKDSEGARVLVVVGCGGDRDKTKRPLMGRAALEEADFAVFTSDNPRREDPTAIIDQIVEGAEEVEDAAGRFAVEPDRRRAIKLAVSMAEAGDVVVVAGKGHETGQIFRDTTIPFDDREVLAEALREASKGRIG